jgi:hypothetical protein
LREQEDIVFFAIHTGKYAFRVYIARCARCTEDWLSLINICNRSDDCPSRVVASKLYIPGGGIVFSHSAIEYYGSEISAFACIVLKLETVGTVFDNAI